VQSAQVIKLEAAENAVLLGVSDGMGGASAGEVASAMVIESLHQALKDAKGDWDAATRQAVEHANQTVWAASTRNEGQRGMGATLTAVCIYGTQAHIAEVGDSRAYLLRSGRLRQMTRDQSFVQLLVEKGVLKKEEADHYPMKNMVLQALGQKPDVQTALGRLELRRGDQLVLCSDGLSNMISDEEMRDTMIAALTVSHAALDLVALANERGGKDNITVVVAQIDGPGLEAPRPEETMTQTFQVLAEYEPPPARPTQDLPSLGDDDEESSARRKKSPLKPLASGQPPGAAATASQGAPQTRQVAEKPAPRVGKKRGVRIWLLLLEVVFLASLLTLAAWRLLK
jgi:serine/threonine protein phosphatase PrpC